MMAPIIAGLLLSRRGRVLSGGAAWALGAAVKWVPLFLFPLELLSDRRRGRLLAGFAVVSAALALFTLWHYGSSRTSVRESISNQVNQLSSISMPYWLTQLGVPQRLATVLLAVVFLGAYAWLARQAWRGRARLGLCAGLFLLAVPWLQPWYVLWPVSLAAVDDDSAARLLAVALTAYFLRDPLPL
jgi:Glycosyltransferase family 87